MASTSTRARSPTAPSPSRSATRWPSREPCSLPDPRTKGFLPLPAGRAGGLFLMPSGTLDAALVAVVAGRAHVDVGDVRPLQQRLGTGRNLSGRNHRAGAVDDAVVGAVAAHDVVRAGQDLGQLFALVGPL